MFMSLVLGATPNDPDGEAAERAMIEYDIDLIAKSSFGRTAEGKKIVAVLRRFDTNHTIAYGDTEGARGNFYGTGITVNKDLSGNVGETILELVHEASHATWRARHPLGKGHDETIDEATDNELFAQENELKIYQWLKLKQQFSDAQMEARLERQAKGTLRSGILEHEKAERESK
jgi:hypothetical protein